MARALDEDFARAGDARSDAKDVDAARADLAKGIAWADEGCIEDQLDQAGQHVPLMLQSLLSGDTFTVASQ
jgi:hypothetical protein